jgi:hypothetical protein
MTSKLHIHPTFKNYARISSAHDFALFNQKFHTQNGTSFGLYSPLIGNPLGVNLSKFLSTCSNAIASNMQKNPAQRIPIQIGEYVIGASAGIAI